MRINKDIIGRLLSVRSMLDLTQDQMAKYFGISRTLYVGIENGRSNISKKSVEKAKNTININPEWLETGEGNMFLQYISPIENLPILNEDMPEKTKRTIEELLEQNNRLMEQVGDLIKMQLYNAESIRNLSAQHVHHQNREINSS